MGHNLKRTVSVTLPAGALIAALGALGVVPATVTARVQFDGRTCYLSHNPQSVQATGDGFLEWAEPDAQQQLTMRLPDMRLSEVGDVAEVRYLYKVECQGAPKTSHHGRVENQPL